jgi:hypothetical protein
MTSAAALGLVAGAAPAASRVAGSYAPHNASAPYAASFGLGIAGTADHRHPVPGETEVLRWTVTNTGTRAWRRVLLRVRVPARWRPRPAAGCRAAGHWVSCEVGGLAARAHRRITLRLVVSPHPSYGTVRIRGTTTAWIGRWPYPGPAASFPLTVVRARG